jgi:hypothetical protein
MIAASKLDFAARMNNPFRFVCFVRVFMALKMLVRLGGSNDNYHHISATTANATLARSEKQIEGPTAGLQK